MNTTIRSIGLAAFGAAALTVVAVQGSQQTDSCEIGHYVAEQECKFEKLMWDLVRNSPDESDLEAYISMFPNGRFLVNAKQRLSGLLPTYGVVVKKPAQS